MELSLTKDCADALYEKIKECTSLIVITVFDEEYPEPLKLMKAKAPPFIYVRGNAFAGKRIALCVQDNHQSIP